MEATLVLGTQSQDTIQFYIEGGEPGISYTQAQVPPSTLLTSAIYLYDFPTPRASCPYLETLQEHLVHSHS